MKHIARFLVFGLMVMTTGSGYAVAGESEGHQITSMEQFLPSANDLAKQHTLKQELYADPAGAGDSDGGGWFCTQYPWACWLLGSAIVTGTLIILKNQSHHDVPPGAPAGGGGGPPLN